MITSGRAHCRAHASGRCVERTPRLAVTLCTLSQHEVFNSWKMVFSRSMLSSKRSMQLQGRTCEPCWQHQQQQQQHKQQQSLCGYYDAGKCSQCRHNPGEQQQQRFQHTLAASVLSAMLLLEALLPQHAAAHVAIDKLMQQQQQEAAVQSTVTAGFDPAAAAAVRAAATGNFSSSSSRLRQSPVASAAAQALSQLQSAQEAQRGGDYAAALAGYSAVVQHHPDLALAEYARLGRALMLYEMGDTSNALLALQDQELSMRGYPEVHAALAAVLYTERPAQRLRAEQQFNIAVEFDGRFQDAVWVRSSKAWGPRLMGALQKFLLLQ